MKKKGQKSCLLLHPDPDLDPDQVRLRRPLLPVPLCLSLPIPPHPTPRPPSYLRLKGGTCSESTLNVPQPQASQVQASKGAASFCAVPLHSALPHPGRIPPTLQT